jgi:hypothetical protein
MGYTVAERLIAAGAVIAIVALVVLATKVGNSND